jgi:hypothetical protein
MQASDGYQVKGSIRLDVANADVATFTESFQVAAALRATVAHFLSISETLVTVTVDLGTLRRLQSTQDTSRRTPHRRLAAVTAAYEALVPTASDATTKAAGFKAVTPNMFQERLREDMTNRCTESVDCGTVQPQGVTVQTVVAEAWLPAEKWPGRRRRHVEKRASEVSLRLLTESSVFRSATAAPALCIAWLVALEMR